MRGIGLGGGQREIRGVSGRGVTHDGMLIIAVTLDLLEEGRFAKTAN